MQPACLMIEDDPVALILSTHDVALPRRGNPLKWKDPMHMSGPPTPEKEMLILSLPRMQSDL